MRYSLSTLETIVTDFGDNLSPKTATIAKNGDCHQKWRLSPNSATVAKTGVCRRIRLSVLCMIGLRIFAFVLQLPCVL